MRAPPRKIEIDGQPVYLRQSWSGWNVVDPFTREDGSHNWFAGWKKSLAPLIFLLLLTGLFIYTYNHEIQQIRHDYGEIAEHPLEFCHKLMGSPLNSLSDLNITTRSTVS